MDMARASSDTAPLIRRGEPERVRGFGIRTLIRSIGSHWKLVQELARREITDPHAGQLAGPLWLIVHPVMMFLIFAFLFTGVFKVRISDRGPTDYLIYLFAGLSPWLLTQDVLSRATSVMIGNAAVVKKVMFPVEVLVAKTLLASLKVQSVLFVLVCAYTIWARGTVPVTFLYLPLLFVLHIALLWGLALFLSSMTPYFRDIAEFIRVFVMANIYLIPLMYLPSMVPENLQFILAINPFSHLIWCYQDVLYYNEIAHPASWGILAAMAAVALVAGSYVFVRLRHHLGSVL
jgi:lipopolysaccharide transport system permease protein